MRASSLCKLLQDVKACAWGARVLALFA